MARKKKKVWLIASIIILSILAILFILSLMLENPAVQQSSFGNAVEPIANFQFPGWTNTLQRVLGILTFFGLAFVVYAAYRSNKSFQARQ